MTAIGEYNGAVWPYSGSFENYMKKLNAGLINTSDNSTWSVNSSARTTRKLHERAGNYWLPNLAPLGKVGYILLLTPLVESRNAADNLDSNPSLVLVIPFIAMSQTTEHQEKGTRMI